MEKNGLGNATWCVIATGQSLKKEDVEYVRSKCKVIVISDAYKLAPWADILVSHDMQWWNKHPNAFKFSGKKYCRSKIPNKVDDYKPTGFPRGCNSGLMGVLIARQEGAKKIILLGFDMHGTHYFGKHTEGLKNTTESRFEVHIRQFNRFTDCEVINCTEGSKLKIYPMAKLRDVI